MYKRKTNYFDRYFEQVVKVDGSVVFARWC